MLTVTQLAKVCNVSRTTVLYYERVGLLMPATRSDNGHRWYGEKERRRLESIMSYRSFGLPVQEIEPLLDRSDEHKQEQTLRQQQKAILALLEQPILFDQNLLTKERRVNVLRSSGMREEDMANWHKQFERMEPDAHQEFLESLQIDADEIAEIRAMARA